MQIIPAILTDNPAELKEKINLVEDKVGRIQIDIIDGVFAPTKTVGPIAAKYIETNLKIDYHLMVNEPINWVEQCVQGYADRIIGHIERMSSQFDFVEKVEEVGAGVGFAIDLETSFNQIHEELLIDLDVLLILSVKAGKSGQELDPVIFEKIEDIVHKRDNAGYDFFIAIDGGVNKNNIAKLKSCGVDEFGITSALFNGNFEQNLREYRDIIMQDG